jgi:hypothetical protein
VIAVHAARGAADPGPGTTAEALAEAVLEAGTAAVTLTVLGGRVVHRAAVPTGAA